MIELLVVMAIMGIVVALVVAVGKYVIEDAARQETRTTQDIVKSAISAYYDFTGEYPWHEGEINTTTLAERLGNAPKARDLLNKLSKEAWTRKPGDDRRKIFDGFDKEMRCGMNSFKRPVLISAGPDKDFETKGDNIRSDSR